MKGLPNNLKEENIYELKEWGYFFQMTFGRKLLSDVHTHDFYELIIVLKGGCTHCINGVNYSCEEGEAVFLRPTDAHCFKNQLENTNVAALSVSVREVNMFISAFGLEQNVAFAAERTHGFPARLCFSYIDLLRIQELCDEILTLKKARRIPLCKALIGEVIASVIKNEYGKAKGIPKDFAAVLSEMNKLENATEGVRAFLRISNFSHAQLCRLTKRYLNMTPSEYVNNIRMKYARELVYSGDADYESICEKVGFRSLSHFYSLFFKAFGTTPAAVRKSRYKNKNTV